MSTRGCIARLQQREPLAFAGVYHHWDSYPSGLGRALFKLRREQFKNDTKAMLDVLIDQHAAGWSTIVGRDFLRTPGYRRSRPKAGSVRADQEKPECYCHGGRKESAWVVTQENASGSGVEYAYAFDGDLMLVLGSYCEDGAKMIGMFGMGEPHARWSVLAEVDLNGAEPDWGTIETAVSA